MRTPLRSIRALGLAVLILVFSPLSAFPLEQQEAMAEAQEIQSLIQAGHNREAEERARALLNRLEPEYGDVSQLTGIAVSLIIEALIAQGKDLAPETLSLAERAVRIFESAPDTSPIVLAQSVFKVAAIHGKAGRWGAAIPLHQRALQIAEKTEHPALCYFVQALGWSHHQNGDYDKAEALYGRCLRLLEQTIGSDNVYYSNTLNDLALLHSDLGRVEKARDLHGQALALQEKHLPAGHILIASSLNNLGIIDWRLGDLDHAEELLERTLQIQTQALGREHPKVAATLNNLGLVHESRGDFIAARDAYEASLAVRQTTGTASNSRQNLAVLLWRMGDWREAERLLRQGLQTREETLGDDHPDVAHTLHLLAVVLKYRGAYDEAERTYQRAGAIQANRLGVDHPVTLLNLLDLVELYRVSGQLGKARTLSERCLELVDPERKSSKELAPVRPFANLAQANVLRDLGQQRSALTYYQRAADVRQLKWGDFNWHFEFALANLLAGVLDKAAEHAIAADDLARESLSLALRALPERQALTFAQRNVSPRDVLLTAAVQQPDAQTVHRAWGAVLRSRAVVLDELSQRRRSLTELSDPEIITLEQNLQSVGRRLANLIVRGPGPDSPDVYQRVIDRTRREWEQAERALADKSAAFRAEQNRARIGLNQLAGSLPADSALIAFALYDRYVPLERKPDADRPDKAYRETPYYLAFILDASDRRPRLVDLGPAVEIDALVSRWRKQIEAGPRVGSDAPRRGLAEYRQAGATLRARVWDPLQVGHSSTKRVFIVPSGSLHAVSFAALPKGKREYLVERGPIIHYLTSERDLVQVDSGSSPGAGLFVLGGAAFDEPATEVAGSMSGGPAEEPQPAANPFRGERSSCAGFERLHFNPLPDTEMEIHRISKLWHDHRSTQAERPEGSVTVRTGRAASEWAVKRLAPGHRVIHLATHGFFLGEECPSALDHTRGIGGLSKLSKTGDSGPTPAGENPLLLAGLSLAGANLRHLADADAEDGVLTAEEVSALDLTGVEWAVLSACDTGAGTIQVGEGVLGLRRGFQTAGVRTVIMSLWSVADDSTRQWMTALYEARLRDGLDTAAAVHQANLRILAERRVAGESVHPFFWAAFIAAGDWR